MLFCFNSLYLLTVHNFGSKMAQSTFWPVKQTSNFNISSSNYPISMRFSLKFMKFLIFSKNQKTHILKIYRYTGKFWPVNFKNLDFLIFWKYKQLHEFKWKPHLNRIIRTPDIWVWNSWLTLQPFRWSCKIIKNPRNFKLKYLEF